MTAAVPGLRHLARLLRDQWKSPAALAEIRDRRLRRLVRHAAARVPFYRSRFLEAGVAPQEFGSAADLARLPLVSRGDLKGARFEEKTAAGTRPGDVRAIATSGSSGEPLEILTTLGDRTWMNPSFIRAWAAGGLRPWHRLMLFEARRGTARRSWYEAAGILRRRRLDPGGEAAGWAAAAADWRPHLLQGYVLTLKLLAAHCRERGERLTLPLVASTSGTLDPSGRRLLEEAFGGRVMDVYASQEAGSVIAWECRECGAYHLGDDTVVTEIVRDGEPAAPGEEGEVVITSLCNYTMPFIRYRLGDRAVRSGAAPRCGRGLPLLEKILGREGDYVLLPGGKRLTPHPFFMVMDTAAGVGQWRIVQERGGALDVFVAPGPGGLPAAAADGIRAGLDGLVGGALPVRLHLVDRVERSTGGKLRSVVSEMPEAD